jgi:fatty-acid desaturase
VEPCAIAPGILIFGTQMAWILFRAAGVINGIGYYWGYRHWSDSGYEDQHRSV